MDVAQYARVSSEQQAKEQSASIDQQLANMDALCERNGWKVVRVLVDCENYTATQSPRKGQVVNPSGERADRPAFVEMLKLVEAGDLDGVVCWRDDRLMRHPRVAVALEDALDVGDVRRNGKDKIQIHDATGAKLDRFTLSIKATIWREENKRRAERTKMGRVATLQKGYWPGSYKRYGYETRKGPRGRIIEIKDDEAEVVRTICQMFDAGEKVVDIRYYLINNGIEQKGYQTPQHEWNHSIIYNIIRAEDYTGIATWKFRDGATMRIEIPPIMGRELWERNQARLDRNKNLSTRNSKGVYLLQGILHCGDCGARMYARRDLTYKDRKGQRRPFKNPPHGYYCHLANRYRNEPHPKPFHRYGPTLDWEVWRYVVDNGIMRPDAIRMQVLARREDLQQQGDSIDGDIAHAQRRRVEVDNQRAFYQRQAARGKMTEQEFDARMEETEHARQHWQDELDRLKELRDDAVKVQSGLDYATELLTSLQADLPEIDQTPKELKGLPAGERDHVLKARRRIIRALCEKAIVWADGRVKLVGVIDGSEAAQFDLGTLSNS